MRRVLLAVAGWLLAAALMVVVGTLAVTLLGTGITGGQVQPLSREAVAQALARSGEQTSTTAMPPASGSPTAPSTAGPSPPASAVPVPSTGQVTRALDSPGGSVIAQCTDSTVYLISWTPRQGFETDEQIRGPAPTAYVKFDSDVLDVLLTVSCQDGVPIPSVVNETEADD